MTMGVFKRAARFTVTVVLTASLGVAAANATDMMATRQAFMKSVGGSLGAVRTAAAAGDMAAAKASAQKLSDGFKIFGASFPAGTDSASSRTRAKAEIWTDATGFKAANDKAIAAADAVVLATGGSDTAAVTASLTSLQQTCGGCHSVYRGPPLS
jgi:cytochrome c556